MKVKVNDKVEFYDTDDINSELVTGVVAEVCEDIYVIMCNDDEHFVDHHLVTQVLGKSEIVTQVPPKTARDHRKDAQESIKKASRAVYGKPGLSDADKVQRISKARVALKEALESLNDAQYLISQQIPEDVLDSLIQSENYLPTHEPAEDA